MRAIIRELCETVTLALLIFLALQFTVQNFRVEGPSMEPTLEEGEFVLVNKFVYFRLSPQDLLSFLPFDNLHRSSDWYPIHAPRRGEVVIFEFPGDTNRDFVKRVIGIPGDFVAIEGGVISVNGEKLNEPYITNVDRRNMPSILIEEDTYFVLGDNRGVSNDSRDWGLVPARNIIGRAWISFWPMDRWQLLNLFFKVQTFSS